MVKERRDVDPKNTWDLEAIFATPEDWQREYERLDQISKGGWQEIEKFKGSLDQGADHLKVFFELYFETEMQIEVLWVYAHLKYDQDLGDGTAKEAHDLASLLCHEFASATSWLDPEILSLPEQTLDAYIAALPLYARPLLRLKRLKPHTLSGKEEALLAQVAKCLETPRSIFTLLNNVDLKFSQAKGKEVTLSQFNLFMRSKDRSMREAAYKSLMGGYESHQNTFCEILNGHVQTHQFIAKSRGYESCLEASLSPHNIDTQVYHTLIKAVREKKEKLHRYITLRKELLELEELYVYDLYVPLVESVDMKFDFDQGVDLIIDSVAPLGKEYQRILKEGLTHHRWVDRYENARKRSGAYSSGCYGHHPYILMNYNEMLDDLMTLTHEAGHSMHTYHSHTRQPYHQSHYTIFVAEVASTFHEELLFRHLMGIYQDPAIRCFLLNQKIDGIRATLFRQVLFAEFELKLHELVEKGIPLTPGTLKEIYAQLNRDYYGESLVVDPHLPLEFMRVPHFYSNFYVYQYATGLSASYALVNRVMEDSSRREDYIEFLSSGGSQDPLDQLKNAGVDMREPGAVYGLIDYFGELLGTFESEMQALRANRLPR